MEETKQKINSITVNKLPNKPNDNQSKQKINQINTKQI